MGQYVSCCPTPKEADSMDLIDSIDNPYGEDLQNRITECNSLQELIDLVNERVADIEKIQEPGTQQSTQKKKKRKHHGKKYSAGENQPMVNKQALRHNLLSVLKSFGTQLHKIKQEESETNRQTQTEVIQQKNQEIQNKLEEVNTLTVQNNNLRTSLQQEIDQWKEKCETQSKNLTETTATVSQLQQKVKDETESRNKLQKELKAAHAKEMQEMLDSRKQLEDKAAILQAQINESESELDIIRRDLKESKEQNKKWEEDLMESEQKCSALEDRSTDREREACRVEQELNAKIKGLQEDIKKLKTDLKKQKEQINEQAQEITGKEREVGELNTLLHEKDKDIDKYINSITEKDKQIKHLSTKLSAEMSTKLAADESNVENVSIKNRPMNVAEEYQIVCTDQWLEAKQILDEEEDIADHIMMQLLCQIIEVAEKEAKEMYQHIHKRLEMLQTDAICYVSQHNDVEAPNNGSGEDENKKPKTKSENHLSKELTNSFGDILRITADNTNIKPLIERVTEALNSTNKDDSDQAHLWNKTHTSPELETYVECVVRVCWKMAIQRPQMEFTWSKDYLGEKHQDLAWNSKPPGGTDPVVLVTVYPMLYHGKSLMAKGKILLLDPKNLE